MSTATLNGFTCVSARVHLPAWGLPFAEVVLDREETIAGAVTLVIADLTVACTVIAGGVWMGRSTYRLVGGAGGWCLPLPAREYRNDLGVKIARVVGDAAAAVGETVEGAPTTTCGPAFERRAGSAAAVLHLLAPRAWRVDADGVTRFGAPPATLVAVTAARGRVDKAAGFVELMADAIATIVPGVVVEGVTATDVVHTLEAGKLRSMVYGARTGTSKRLVAYEQIMGALFPSLRYAGPWEYRVVFQHGEKLDLQPVRASLGMPTLLSCAVRPGVPGCRATHKLGALAHVEFLNQDPARPCVVAFDDADSPGFAPSELFLDVGYGASDHIATSEAIVAFATQLLTAIGAANPGPILGVSLAGMLPAAVAAALPLTATVPLSAPVLAALAAALAVKTSSAPSMGCPTLRSS